MNRLRKPLENFTMAPNGLICDPNLSLKAKGVYCLLFSKPDEWIYVEEVLVKESADGRDSFRSAVKELLAVGWLTKRQVQDCTARFSHTDWVLSVDGQSPTNKTNQSNTDQTNIPPVSPEPENPTKASRRANPVRSIAVILEDLATIPDDMRERGQGHNVADLDGEWAKFRNHHISLKSRHTRVDLCWDTWCRNTARFAAGRPANAGGPAGQGGYRRHDIVAAATDRALADVFGVRREGRGGQPDVPGADPNPFGDGAGSTEASLVDVTPGDDTRLKEPGCAARTGEDRHAGAALPCPVE